MSLADLFGDGDYRFHMALRRGTAAEFFAPTKQRESPTAERRRWLRAEPHTYSACLPACVPLLDECIALARSWVTLSDDDHARVAAGEAASERCLRLGEKWEPDFLLLKAGEDKQFRLLGGCVCFPSSWTLADKIGRPLDFIHGSVPGLNEQLGRSIDSFLARLTPDAAWLRHNWGLSRSPELNQHPRRALPPLDCSVTLRDVWLRVEHQALVALPQSGGVLFGIRVAVHPLAEVNEDSQAAVRLARALRTMPDAVASYKGLITARQRILHLLET